MQHEANLEVPCSETLILPIMFASEVKVAQSCPTLCNPMDCSLPGSPVHGILFPSPIYHA